MCFMIRIVLRRHHYLPHPFLCPMVFDDFITWSAWESTQCSVPPDPFLQDLSIMRACKWWRSLWGIRSVPWGSPWLCFAEMLWIGPLKRLSSGWPAAIKSSPNGCNDAAVGSLYLCLILQLVTVFSLLLSTALHLNQQRFCDSLRSIL